MIEPAASKPSNMAQVGRATYRNGWVIPPRPANWFPMWGDCQKCQRRCDCPGVIVKWEPVDEQ